MPEKLRLIILFFAVWSIDLVINVINNGRPAWVPILWIDTWIPFVPVFIYFYTIYFPLVVAPLFLLPLVHLKHYVYSNICVMIISYAVFLFIPTKVMRVKLGSGSAAETVTSLYHQIVAPYNLLPSLHVSMLLLAFLSLYFYKKNLAFWMGIPIAMSIASVVFTKQHYILDVLIAAPLAILVFVLVKAYAR